MNARTLIIIALLLLLFAVVWKAWLYRQNALSALAKIDLISERFTRTDYHREANGKWSGQGPDIVFLGASITNRWRPDQAFPAWRVASRGVGGQWPSHYLLRFRADVLDLAPRAFLFKTCSISFRPGVSQDGIREATLTMLELAEGRGIMPILATCVPVRSDGNVIYDPRGELGGATINDAMRPFNEWLRQLSAERGYRLVDFWSGMADEDGFLPPELCADDIHPNEAGYDLMTEIARPVLRAALGGEGS